MCGRCRLNLLYVNHPGAPREIDPIHMKKSPDHILITMVKQEFKREKFGPANMLKIHTNVFTKVTTRQQ